VQEPVSSRRNHASGQRKGDGVVESLRRHKTLVIVGVILLALLIYWLSFVSFGAGRGGLKTGPTFTEQR
jgi:hypothetical protein